MVFSSLVFLCVFFPLQMLVYYLAKGIEARNTVLILFSLVFYAWGEPFFIVLLLFMCFVDWAVSQGIYKYRGTGKSKAFLVLGCVIDLGLLAFFKYTMFILTETHDWFGFPSVVPQIALPIGISFYTFQTMSYTIDVYRGRAHAQRNLATLATFVCLFPQLIAPYDPIATDVTVSNQAPSAEHWFGTDFYGRDIFSRVVWGTRIDLLIGVLGVVIPFLVGGMIGLLAGYYGGVLDSLLMRITDIMMAFPFTILVITIMAILGQGLINLFIALWLVGWMSYAKLVRSEVLVLKDAEFIQAARVAGFSDARILFRHLLPNVISSAVVFAASDVVMCMLTGASMSFLGLGVSPPTPEWGAILNEGRTFITFAWWETLFPGLFLAVSGVGFSLLGDGLTDFLRTKGR